MLYVGHYTLAKRYNQTKTRQTKENKSELGGGGGGGVIRETNIIKINTVYRLRPTFYLSSPPPPPHSVYLSLCLCRFPSSSFIMLSIPPFACMPASSLS